MSDIPIQVIVAAFQDEKGADQALQELKRAKWEGLIGIQEAAVIRRDEKNKLHIKDTGDMGGGKGAVIGGVLGGVIGLLAGPVGLIGIAGAVVGGLAAKLSDGGLPDERLKEIGAALTPGTSAIVAIIEHKWVEELRQEMQEAGAQVVTEAIRDDIAQQLKEGRDVAFTAVETEDTFAIGRMAGDEDQVEISGLAVTDDGLVFSEEVQTAEGVAGRRIVSTDEGTAEIDYVATEEGAAAVGAIETSEGVITGAVVVTPEEEGEAEEPEEGNEE